MMRYKRAAEHMKQTNLQIINSVEGKPEYILLPIRVYTILRDAIKQELKSAETKSEYVPFDVADYVDNPIGTHDSILSEIMMEKYIAMMEASPLFAQFMNSNCPYILNEIKALKRRKE